jgi:hypothetical protein
VGILAWNGFGNQVFVIGYRILDLDQQLLIANSLSYSCGTAPDFLRYQGTGFPLEAFASGRKATSADM